MTATRTPKVGEVWSTSTRVWGTCVVDVPDETGNYVWWTPDGRYLVYGASRLVPPPEPLPERWINIWPDGYSKGFSSRENADRTPPPNRLGVIHLHPDGTVEFERTP